MPRPADPDVAEKLVQAAARILSTEGLDAVSARRLAREVDASTMAVYTHFGGMDELLAAVRREGFRLFGLAIGAPELTDDPVADWMVQGWAYRRFALDERHMWTVIFSRFGQDMHDANPEDAIAAIATFTALQMRVERCVTAGRWDMTDTTIGAEVCWTHVHGIAAIELSGYFEGTGRDPIRAMEESATRTAVGFGDQLDRVQESARVARDRARRAGDLGM